MCLIKTGLFGQRSVLVGVCLSVIDRCLLVLNDIFLKMMRQIYFSPTDKSWASLKAEIPSSNCAHMLKMSVCRKSADIKEEGKGFEQYSKWKPCT